MTSNGSEPGARLPNARVIVEGRNRVWRLLLVNKLLVIRIMMRMSIFDTVLDCMVLDCIAGQSSGVTIVLLWPFGIELSASASFTL